MIGRKTSRIGLKGFLPISWFLVSGSAYILLFCACQTMPTVVSTQTLLPTTKFEPLPTSTPVEELVFPKIDRHPRPATVENWSVWGYGKALDALPAYDPNENTIWKIDVRAQDLSGLDLRESSHDLLSVTTFDEQTAWPPSERLPKGFDPQKIMELGKNPGLGLRGLHAQGITGKGVGIAIIDSAPLNVDHPEYAQRLRLYEERSTLRGVDPVQMHGPAVASLAVGKTVGTAPGADLYYITVPIDQGQDANGNWLYDFNEAAGAVRRIVEVNKQLPEDRKIRVLSMSFGWMEGLKGYEELAMAVKEAHGAGIFIVSATPSMEKTNGFGFFGLGRKPMSDPDQFESYTLPDILAPYFFADPTNPKWLEHLWVPMDNRTTASPIGSDEYVFYRLGGESWRIPYLAGIYALAAQVEPGITVERFLELARETGKMIQVENEGKTYTIGPVIDPTALIQKLDEAP